MRQQLLYIDVASNGDMTGMGREHRTSPPTLKLKLSKV